MGKWVVRSVTYAEMWVDCLFAEGKERYGKGKWGGTKRGDGRRKGRIEEKKRGFFQFKTDW